MGAGCARMPSQTGTFQLGHEGAGSRQEMVPPTVPLAVMGHARNANLKVQGSGVTGSVGTGRPQHSPDGRGDAPATPTPTLLASLKNKRFQRNRAPGFSKLVT